MNKIRMIPLFLMSVAAIIFGIFEYVKYKLPLFIFLTIVFFVMLLITNSIIFENAFLDNYQSIIRIFSLFIFFLTIAVGIILKLFVYIPLGKTGINNIDCFEFIIFGISGSWYIVFLKTFKGRSSI
ncbi:MAG: hypothetical protein IKQ84_08900 [Spirochaetaceae bacterium]|nr:hypothetical protein [Spirochaetaceae bacterium]